MPAFDMQSPGKQLIRLENELRSQRIRLAFRDAELERDYHLYHLNAHYLWARITAVLGIGLFLLFGLMDRAVQPPDVAATLMKLRLLVATPFLIIVCLLSLLPRARDWGIRFWFHSTLVVALLTVGLVSFAALRGGAPPFEQIIVFQIAASVLLGLLFWQVALINLAVLVPFAVVVLLASASFRYPYWSVIELGASGALCCMGAWFLERRGRREYIARRLLELSASLDGLTRLANRRKLMEQLRVIWRQARRDTASVGVMMIDIDHFKEYNDRYGHMAGDQCLQSVADVLAGCTQRPLDLACRFGGEEFVLIFYGADDAALAEIGESVRRRLAVLDIPHAGSSTSDRLTVSIGAVCCFPHLSVTSDTVMRAVDAALYEAKRGGRNRQFVGAMSGGQLPRMDHPISA